MTYSVLYSGGGTLGSALISLATGDTATHVGICPNRQHVIDATLLHGVKRWDRDEWLSMRHAVDEHELTPADETHEEMADEYVRGMLGRHYDWLEIIGFLVMRDLGMGKRPVCSSLGRDWVCLLTGKQWPGKTGRTSPRHLRLFTGGMQ